MLKRIFKYLFFGISWGCTFFVFTLLIGVLTAGNTFLEPIVSDFVRQTLGAVLVGILCGSTAILYTFDRLPTWICIVIHFAVGISGYLAVAWHLGWIPAQTGIRLLISVIIAICIFTALWFIFYFINRSEAKRVNKRLQELQENLPS